MCSDILGFPFASFWWLMILSNFLCVYWPFIYFPLWSVCLNLCVIICWVIWTFVLELQGFCIYIGYIPFSDICVVNIFFLPMTCLLTFYDIFWWIIVWNFLYSPVYQFFILWLMLSVCSKNSLLTQRLWRYSIFSSWSFIVLCLGL